MKFKFGSGVIALFLASQAVADEFTPAMQDYYETEVVSWASDRVLVDAILAQNERTLDYSQDEILALDQRWRNEINAADKPLVESIVASGAADFLRERVAASDGRITEVILMDARGLNVAASDVTSDYWQGDEAKFTETYDAGAGALHISDVEFDESTQRYQGQLSFTVTDPSSGAPIGAVTVGIDAESLL